MLLGTINFGAWDFSSQPGTELVSPALPGKILNQWTTRGVSRVCVCNKVLGAADDACLGTTFRTAVHDEASAYFSDFCLYIMPPLTMPSSQDANNGPGSGGRRKEQNVSICSPSWVIYYACQLPF